MAVLEVVASVGVAGAVDTEDVLVANGKVQLQ